MQGVPAGVQSQQVHTLAGVGPWRRLRCGSLEASKHESGAPLQLITCSSGTLRIKKSHETLHNAARECSFRDRLNNKIVTLALTPNLHHGGSLHSSSLS